MYSFLFNFIHKGYFTNSQTHAVGSTERPTGIVSCHIIFINLYSLKTDVSLWSKEQVTSWLSTVQSLDENNKQEWESLQASGKSLRGITQETLEKRGMAYGPAFDVVLEIKKLLGQRESAAPSSTFPYPLNLRF